MKIKPKIVIGLGNPGKEYTNTYHNAGFLFIDYLVSKNSANSKFKIPQRKAFGFLRGRQNSKLLKSDVFMNESGKFVAKMLKKNGVKPEEVLIVHDDSDIELGKYKLSFGRGSAGHKGAESIIKSLGAKNFWRLRIGIRPPAKNIGVNQRTYQRKSAISRRKASEIVLEKITTADLKILNQVFEEIIKNSSID